MHPETQAPSPSRLRRAAALLLCALTLPTAALAVPPDPMAAPKVAPLDQDDAAPEAAGADAEADADEDADEEPLVPPAWDAAHAGTERAAAADPTPPAVAPPAEGTSNAEAPVAYLGTDAYGNPLTAEEAEALAADEDGPDPESGLMTQVGLSLALGKATDTLGRNAGSNAGTAVRAFIGAAILPQLCLGVTGIYAGGSADNHAYTVETQGLLLTGQWRPFGGERNGVVLGVGLGVGNVRLTQAREEVGGADPFVGETTGGVVALSLGWTADALNLGGRHRISLAPTFTWMRLPAQDGSETDHELFTLGIDLRWMATSGGPAQP